jgi:hypothetical protein
MQQEIDWRHMVAAGVLVVALLGGVGWMLINRPSEQPRAVAPAGPNATMRDAPEHPPATANGVKLPTAQ